MHKLQQKISVRPNRSHVGMWAAMIAASVWLNPHPVQADITNVIWQATLSGKLAIQQYNVKLQPRMVVAKFTNRDFISMVEGTTTATNQVLGVNLVMVGGQTNFYLSVYDSSTRMNALRITTNEITTLVSDGNKLTFTVEAPILSSTTTNGTWGGGFIRAHGQGRSSRVEWRS